VLDLVNYAKDRGVRVVPEVDSPGHTFSWGIAFPDIILNCTNVMSQPKYVYYPNINNACFDMTNANLYGVVKDVMIETAGMFPDSYFHVGGDEVAFSCLEEFPRIKQWMSQQGMDPANYADLVQYYTLKLGAIVSAQAKKNMIFWQEGFYNAYSNPTTPKSLPNGTIFQVWENVGSFTTMSAIIKAGFQVLLSAGWYLDQQVPSVNGTTRYLWEDTFIDFYNNEPTYMLQGLSPEQLKLILGGEVCQWGEQIDDNMLWTRLLPRAAAVAERLWSPQGTSDLKSAYLRAFSLRCRLAQRGFPASSLRPDYCELSPPQV